MRVSAPSAVSISLIDPMPRSLAFIFTTIVLCGYGASAERAAAAAPRKKVLVVGIDGLRPDLLMRADAGKINAVCREQRQLFE